MMTKYCINQTVILYFLEIHLNENNKESPIFFCFQIHMLPESKDSALTLVKIGKLLNVDDKTNEMKPIDYIL